MAAVRYGRVRLFEPFSRRTAGKHFSKCDASTSVPDAHDRSKLRAWSGQRGVEVPRKKIIPKNAVLRSLKDSVVIDWRMNSLYPCNSLELAPTAIGSKKNSLKAAQHAKEAVELLASGSELLGKGMSWVGETKAAMDYIKLPSGEEETGEPTVSGIIDVLIAEQDLKKFYVCYQNLITNGVEIPAEMKEKLVASACFVAATSRTDMNEKNIKVLDEILDLTAPLTKSMLLVVIQCFVEMGIEARYTKWFEKLLEKEENLDSATASSLLNISNTSSLKSKVIDMLTSRKIPPTASGVLASFPYEDCFEMPAEEIAEVLSKYIEEANHCSTNTQLEVLVEALGFVSSNLMNASIMHALLSRMESHGSEKIQNSKSFVDAMIAADKSRDIELANKILSIACRHCKSLPQRFFSTYIFCVGKSSTSEVFMENIAGYFGPVANINGNMFEGIVNLCSRRKWPHVLPLLFSTFDNPLLNHRYYTSWLQCATNLLWKADADCIEQFKSICNILVNLLKLPDDRTTLELRSSLVDLMLNCDHQQGLREYLVLAGKNRNLKKEAPYTVCETALKTGV